MLRNVIPVVLMIRNVIPVMLIKLYPSFPGEIGIPDSCRALGRAEAWAGACSGMFYETSQPRGNELFVSWAWAAARPWREGWRINKRVLKGSVWLLRETTPSPPFLWGVFQGNSQEILVWSMVLCVSSCLEELRHGSSDLRGMEKGERGCLEGWK